MNFVYMTGAVVFCVSMVLSVVILGHIIISIVSKELADKSFQKWWEFTKMRRQLPDKRQRAVIQKLQSEWRR